MFYKSRPNSGNGGCVDGGEQVDRQEKQGCLKRGTSSGGRLIDQAAASVSGLEAEEEEEEGAGGRRLAPVVSGGEEMRVPVTGLKAPPCAEH